MNVLFLGTGTSQGIPMIGCECGVCRSEDARDKRTRSSIWVEGRGGAVLVDTTPDLRQQALREGLSRVDAVVFTHGHADHIFGFDDLRRFCDLNRAPMPVHASAETLETLGRAFQYAFNGENRHPGYVRPEPREFAGPFELAGMRVEPLPVRHGNVVTHGLLFEEDGRAKLAYFPDCKELPEGTLERVRGAEVLVIDALRYEAHPTHMSVGEALEAVRRIGPGRALFTHIAHAIAHAELGPRLPEGVGIAWDGMRLEL